ncbi:hypothetical protein ACFX13_003431 [Malus domestica]
MLKMVVARLSTKMLTLIPCPKSLARRVLPDKTCPTKPDRKAEARQQPSTGAEPPGELCARWPGSHPRQKFLPRT